ncbi:MAG: Eco57I restriction-modification methylase domain-containing protein [Candidatus Delongbacteria bacterium]|jgi:hypothetical protein|nr:Eco57I restriction-modification methylase domain-containing protein [Candidatus Delongbacteria bacterium]
MSRQDLSKIIENFSIDGFKSFFRNKVREFIPSSENLYNETDKFIAGQKLGTIDFRDDKVVVFAYKSVTELTEKKSKRAQYELSKKILKTDRSDAGIFIFYDEIGNFRFSLIYINYLGTKRDWSLYKRFTYYVNKEKSNKTFLKQIGVKEFTSLDDIKAAFSLKEVTDEFYKEFYPIFQKVSLSVIGDDIDSKVKEDFALLFVIRTIFIGFIQKRKWIGDDEEFLEYFLKEYDTCGTCNELYMKWIKPLFFESLNSAPGTKTAYRNNNFSEELEYKLQMAPYLNGGLFSDDKEIDRKGYYIPDEQIKEFFDFLFQYNFTIEENTLYDEELELNPEFLGIIFERLVNKADGAVYTPRTEVDLMCRLSLVKWIFKNTKSKIQKRDLYELFFHETEEGEENQRHGSFSEVQYKEIITLLENVTVCDPAVGSGAFLVGMMQVIEEIEERIYKKELNKEVSCAFERKKRIISQSLYGVEVKEWAVWIAQLRLWISLFIDAPPGMRDSLEPILPSLDFKIRQGDSLIQMIGSKQFPISGHADISSSIKRKVTMLKNDKVNFFFNKSSLGKDGIKKKELKIFKDILDDEISIHEQAIYQMKDDSKVKEVSLFGDETPKTEQLKLNLFEKDIEKHQKEIKELQSQKDSLSKNKPLIWSIEFSEIFVENGGFDVIIGNPPYVRQEDIADPMGKIEDKKQYKILLADMVRMDFPEHFIKQKKINAQSDLYTYFYIRSLKLLNQTGIHTFICSNSWLDVGYGVWLQEFLLVNAPIDFIIDNHAKRSFDAADVNTIISIINAPVKRKKIDDNHQVKFIAFKRPFEETIFSEYLLNIENAKQIEKNKQYRVYPISLEELKEAGSEFETEEDEKLKTAVGKYVGDKWGGKFLRAPDIFFTILKRGKEKLVKLNTVAVVIPGCYSGINDFFYLDEGTIHSFKIEKEYLQPLIRNSRSITSLRFETKQQYYVLAIDKVPINKLQKNVVNYIKWGETQKTKKKQKTKAGIPWNKVESVKNRKFWYSIPEKNLLTTKLFMQYVANDRFYCPFTDYNMASDRCFHRIFIKDYKNIYNLSIILNSTLTIFYVMLLGRSGLGQGALKFEAKDAVGLFILDPNLLSKVKTNSTSLNNIGSRKPVSVFEECGIDPELEITIEEQEPKPLPDRKELDDIVFDALELTEDERKEVYRAVCRLVWNRISKAKSV